jgi:hypothetical protein
MRKDAKKGYAMLVTIEGEPCSHRWTKFYFTGAGVHFMAHYKRVLGQITVTEMLIHASVELMRIMAEEQESHAEEREQFLAHSLRFDGVWSKEIIAKTKDEAVGIMEFCLPRDFFQNLQWIRDVGEYGNLRLLFESILRFSFCLSVASASKQVETGGLLH